jgi:integrase
VNGARVVKQFATQREAKVYERQSKAAADKAAFTPPRRDGKTVIDAVELYLEWCKAEELGGELRRQTVEYYSRLIHLHIVPRLVETRVKGKLLKVPLGKVKLANLTRSMVEQWRLEMVGTGKRVTAVHALVQLKQILNNAMRLGLVEHNVALPVKIKQKAPPRKLAGRDFPNIKEVLLVMQEAEGYLRPILITLLSTGMRQGELRALTWDDVDFDRRIIRIEHTMNRLGESGPTKTESGVRAIHMGDVLAQALSDWKDIYPQGLLDADGKPIRFYIPEHQVLEIAKFLYEKPGVSEKKVAELFDRLPYVNPPGAQSDAPLARRSVASSFSKHGERPARWLQRLAAVPGATARSWDDRQRHCDRDAEIYTARPQAFPYVLGTT